MARWYERIATTGMVTWFAGWSLACFFGGGVSIPEPDDCRSPDSQGVVTTLEIGTGDPFEPLEEGDSIYVVTGGQGASMVDARLRLDADSPRCLSQETVLLDDMGEVLGTVSVPLRTVRVDGGRVTGAIPVILNRTPRQVGDIVTLEAEAYGVRHSVSLVAEGDIFSAPTPKYETQTTGATGDTGAPTP